MAEACEALGHGTTLFDGACVGFWIMVLFAPPPKADRRLVRGTLTAMAKRSAQPFPTLIGCLTDAGYRVDAETRTAATDVTRELSAHIRADATLIEGEGFLAPPCAKSSPGWMPSAELRATRRSPPSSRRGSNGASGPARGDRADARARRRQRD